MGDKFKLKESRKLAIVFLISLLFMLNAFIYTTSAQNDERLKAKAEALLNIVHEVKTSLTMIFNKIALEGLDVPYKAKKSYLEGNLLANESLRLFQERNYLQTSSKAVESLQMLKEALRIADQVLPNKPVPSEVAAQKAIALKATIKQSYEYISRLENMYNQTRAQGYNSSALQSSIEEAKQHLESARMKLDLMEINGTEQQLVLVID